MPSLPAVIVWRRRHESDAKQGADASPQGLLKFANFRANCQERRGKKGQKRLRGECPGRRSRGSVAISIFILAVYRLKFEAREGTWTQRQLRLTPLSV